VSCISVSVSSDTIQIRYREVLIFWETLTWSWAMQLNRANQLRDNAETHWRDAHELKRWTDGLQNTFRVRDSPGMRNSEFLHRNSTTSKPETAPVIIRTKWDQSGSQSRLIVSSHILSKSRDAMPFSQPQCQARPYFITIHPFLNDYICYSLLRCIKFCMMLRIFICSTSGVWKKLEVDIQF